MSIFQCYHGTWILMHITYISIYLSLYSLTYICIYCWLGGQIGFGMLANVNTFHFKEICLGSVIWKSGQGKFYGPLDHLTVLVSNPVRLFTNSAAVYYIFMHHTISYTYFILCRVSSGEWSLLKWLPDSLCIRTWDLDSSTVLVIPLFGVSAFNQLKYMEIQFKTSYFHWNKKKNRYSALLRPQLYSQQVDVNKSSFLSQK